MSDDVHNVGKIAAGNRGMGRKKGQVNKATRAVKEALQEAFENLGGVPALVIWAKTDPTEFYKLWAKLLPTEVKAKVETIGDIPVGKVQIEVINANTQDTGD